MTRLTILTLLSITALAAQAQNPAATNDATMQNMMQGVQEMMACMGNIDQSEMERLGKEGEQLYAVVKALCDEGKRGEAQSTAMEYGMKIAKDPTVQVMAECGKKAQGMMPQSMRAPTPEELQDRHVCDIQ